MIPTISGAGLRAVLPDEKCIQRKAESISEKDTSTKNLNTPPHPVTIAHTYTPLPYWNGPSLQLPSNISFHTFHVHHEEFRD